MSHSHDSHEGNAGPKSGAWVMVLIVVLLALLVVPVLSALGLVGFFTLSRVEVAPAELSTHGATATLTSNGVTITSVAEKNSRMRINDTDYGVVQPGDQVRLEGGRVTINGQVRIP